VLVGFFLLELVVSGIFSKWKWHLLSVCTIALWYRLLLDMLLLDITHLTVGIRFFPGSQRASHSVCVWTFSETRGNSMSHIPMVIGRLESIKERAIQC